jgi:HPt (histidine-containing phosphotransfer) domain-containing protein
VNSTRRAQSKGRIPIALDDAQESLRRKFHQRLQSERVQLAGLATTLTQAGKNTDSAFEELRWCAHRMHGAAAIFEYADVAAAAHALEYASEAALVAHAGSFEPSVWAALVSLVGILDHVAPQSREPSS